MEHFFEAGMHWRILNFFIFLGGLVFFLRKPLREFWETRSNRTRFEMEEAAKLRAGEEERYRALQTRIASLEKEAAALISSLKEEGELERSRLVADGERYAAKLKSDGERIAEQEVQKAKARLLAEAVRLSIDLAERLVREKIDPEDQKRLAEGYLGRLEGRA